MIAGLIMYIIYGQSTSVGDGEGRHGCTDIGGCDRDVKGELPSA
jgi:hypothetical protein